MRRLLPLLPLLPLAAACKLTEVTVAPGTQMVVVQSVLSRGAASQYVVLEYSLAGDSVPGPTGDSVPPDSPKFPISGATVSLAAATRRPLRDSPRTSSVAAAVLPAFMQVPAT